MEIRVRSQRTWHLGAGSEAVLFLGAVEALCSLVSGHGHVWAVPFQTQILTFAFISLAQGLLIKTLERAEWTQRSPGLGVSEPWARHSALPSPRCVASTNFPNLSLSRVVHAEHSAWRLEREALSSVLCPILTRAEFQSCVPVNTAEGVGCNM